MSRVVMGPFNRVEGDLQVRLEIGDAHVRSAHVTAPMYRGFETMLEGRPLSDALAIVPRVCGICSISQSVAAATALGGVRGLAPPPNGRLAFDILLAAENLADHLTHFHLFFMPDFTGPAYAAEPWAEEARRRFAPMTGDAARRFMEHRRALLKIIGLLAGKWPHTLAIQPGGLTCAPGALEKARLIARIDALRRFLEETFFAAPLEEVASITSAEQLWAWAEDGPEGDARFFLRIARALKLDERGRTPRRFLSHGAYPLPDGTHLFVGGILSPEGLAPLDTGGIVEDTSHAWLGDGDSPRHPFAGVTRPDVDNPRGYTWCKAPRLNGMAMEVGALARQVVDGHPLLRDLARDGGNVLARIVARFIELARVTPAMREWARQLRINEPFITHEPCAGPRPRAAGLTEAARGALGHWLVADGDKIAGYQIIAPTTWNFSPRDRNGDPGPLEQALRGISMADEARGRAMVQHVVRSFDPCMVCTVH